MVWSDFGTAAQEAVRENGMATVEKSWILLCQGNKRKFLKAIVSLQHLHLVLFSMLYKVVPTFFLSLWMKYYM